MPQVDLNTRLRQFTWLLFWTLAAISALVVLLFLWATVPLLVTVAMGGWGHVWFFGNTGLVLVAALAYLVIAVAVFAKRYVRGANGVGT